MSREIANPQPWSRRKWRRVIGIVLAAQVALIWLLADRSAIVPRQPHSSTVLRFELDSPPGSPLANELSMGDPTLFALPSQHGFSGDAWLNLPAIKHHLKDWTETNHWLAPNANLWGTTFRQFVQAQAPAWFLAADKPEPRLVELFVTNEPAPDRSSCQATGELKNRPLRTDFQLPILTNDEYPRASIVQVAVDRSGNTVSAQLWMSSGLPAADQYALATAKKARYQPLPGEDNPAPEANPFPLTWGNLVFHWCVTNAPLTNAPEATP
ncbi:MAG: energy transducer TonB [Candidatus Omnitrophica bacterium]|nr:energy transducer TonB [Candidatus Omnitrophota bacterium]